MNLDGFRQWLVEEEYRYNTVNKTVNDLATYLRSPELAKNPASQQRAYDYRRAFQRYQEYAEAVGLPPLSTLPPPEPKPAKRHQRRRERQRKKVAQSIREDQWNRLVGVIQQHTSPQARVLEVIAHTGLRIGDVLRVERAQLRQAMRTGTLRLVVKGGDEIDYTIVEAPYWKRLLKGLHTSDVNVASACSSSPHPEADGPSYKSVVRMMHKLAKYARVDGRIHVHRMRRTVAVLLLKRGVPLEHVQRVLGHSSRRTTEVYLTEVMPDVVANALKKLHEEDKETDG